ncbi:MAG: L-glutamate gamma-semialdehyde dehydrogenase [Myxococcales bacterium]|nr:L-glutamate gamma-semialdehyde dehydrogenase [Myxococcales bacterium]
MDGHLRVPAPKNEAPRSYAPGSAQRESVRAELARLAELRTEVPLWIGGQDVFHQPVDLTSPHEKRRIIARVASATADDVQAAIEAALAAKREWARLPYADRAAVFLKAAELLAGPYRDRINAATMLGQSKTIHQSEIDAVSELCDFWRFNAAFGDRLLDEQPISVDGVWNQQELRPLDGFVFAVTPFNFTAIAGNLPTAPALMGNTCVWKPAPTQMLSAQVIIDVLKEAGLPPGVINMVAGDPQTIGQVAIASEHLAGLHFTGSTSTFRHLWKQIGMNIDRYRQYPRIVGETGGKDFIFAHPSASVPALVTAIIRGGFEFQGQKCSAASRAYVPRSIWKELEEPLLETIRSLRYGDVRDFSNFMGAVIDERAFQKITGYAELARSSATVLAGGNSDGSEGWFVAPTLVRVDDPRHRLMQEEIFGPIVTVWVYEDTELEDALRLCDETSPYALTGAIFARDRRTIRQLSERLRFAAGNFYINDKPTGSVVGQQPFGGSRGSGTNDKAGSAANLMRWASVRAVKESFVSPTDHRYPHMEPER